MNFAPQHTRILIVDDTLQNIQVLGTTLKKEGYQLNAAQNGQQALKLAQKTLPDLILLDIMMPEMDGFEVCQHLKADDKTRHIPVVFLSAKVETQDMVKGFELGAIDYITKPFNTVELLKRVETHLELALLRTDLQKQVAEKTAQLEVEHGERLRAEKQLAQTQRLEAVGRLAFGAAHEINSPMQAVSSNTAFALDALKDLKNGLAPYEKLRTLAASAIPANSLQEIDAALEEADIDYILAELPRALEKVQSNAERVGKIVRAMQDLSRPSDSAPTPTDLNALVQSSTNTLGESWSTIAHLDLDLDDTLPEFHCHPGDFAQVIVHLLTNATQAIAALAGQDQGRLGVCTRYDNNAIELIISDTGTGIPEEVRHRIFEPF
ncbi:MAG: two-component system NtrC family sensor kinase [Planctomycetota bacterium]|jgi:two-component system NtrC family sensor kinase